MLIYEKISDNKKEFYKKNIGIGYNTIFATIQK